MITPKENLFDYNKNGLNCKLILSLESSEKIKFKIIENEKNFESKYNLDNLKRKNKFFQILDISEIYDIISNILTNKTYNLEKKEHSFLLQITIEFYGSKNDIIFEIIDVNQDKDDLIQQLLIEQKEIKDQLNLIQTDIKEKFNLIMNKLNQLTNDNILEEENNFEKVLQKSKIIEKKVDFIKSLKNWICSNENLDLKCKLLYDAKKDGGLCTVFHQLCDNKGPTLIIIKTNDGKRIGGFTFKDWNKSTNDFISDNKAFIFDLAKNQRYNVVSADKAIYSGADYGPIFGANHDIVIYKNCFVEKGGYYYKPNNSYYDYSNCNDDNKAQVYFKVEEMEVYQIIF